MRRQLPAQRLVVEIDVQMREDGALRLYALATASSDKPLTSGE
jgi:hypothetical protein